MCDNKPSERVVHAAIHEQVVAAKDAEIGELKGKADAYWREVEQARYERDQMRALLDRVREEVQKEFAGWCGICRESRPYDCDECVHGSTKRLHGILLSELLSEPNVCDGCANMGDDCYPVHGQCTATYTPRGGA